MNSIQLENELKSLIEKEISKAESKAQEVQKSVEQKETTSISTQEEWETASDTFIRSPTLQGFDSDARLIILFMAVQNGCEEDKICSIHTCPKCNEQIEPQIFAEEFVKAYNSETIDQTASITKTVAKSAYEALKQKWGSFVYTIVDNFIPSVEKFLSTNPEQLNENENFPYYIKDNTIYHKDCVEYIE